MFFDRFKEYKDAYFDQYQDEVQHDALSDVKAIYSAYMACISERWLGNEKAS